MERKLKHKESGRDIRSLQRKDALRKKLQEPLAGSERRYRLLADHLSDGVFVLDRDGKFVFVNKIIERRSGIPFNKFTGLHFLDLVAPKHHERVIMNFEKIMRGEKPPPYDVEYSASDGTPRWVEVNTQPIYENSQVIGLQGISRDVSDRKRVEGAIIKAHEELERSAEDRASELTDLNEQLELVLSQRRQIEEDLTKSKDRFRELADLLPEIIFETDMKGGLTYSNRVGFEKFGYSRKDFDQGFSCFQTVVPEDRKRLRKNVSRLMKGKRLGLGEYLAQRKDGTTFPVIIHGNVILDENWHPVGLRGIMVDITERVRAREKLFNYQNQLRSLASELSLAEERIRRHTATELHDSIAQTVAFAKMKLGVLRKSASTPYLSDTLDEVLELLNETIENTRSLISELSSPILYELGLVPAIEWLVQQMKQRYGIRVSFDDDDQPKPLGDDVRVLLFQAARELLVNVTKHAKAESVKVSILRDNNEIHIKVEDDGVGFEAEKIGRNIKQTNSFGLFSIRERLEPIGGYVRIESEPGKGTRGTLVAPIKFSS